MERGAVRKDREREKRRGRRREERRDSEHLCTISSFFSVPVVRGVCCSALFLSLSLSSSSEAALSRMDVRLVLTTLALGLTAAAASDSVSRNVHNATTQNATSAPRPSTTPTCPPCATPSTVPAAITTPTPSFPVLAVVTVMWRKACEGGVVLSLPSERRPVCGEGWNASVWPDVCERAGCRGAPRWSPSPSSAEEQPGYLLNRDHRFLEKKRCRALWVRCEVDPGLAAQLFGYQAVTGLLLTLVLLALLVLLVRFGRPSLTALQKRMSDRRQSRWIGPTQSQSVSYHRGKPTTAQINDDADKRSSFAALERLTINYSREPSSNRNSDYDSYN